MAEISGMASGFVHRLAPRLAVIIALGAFSMPMSSASAQNLVEDPNFVDGLEYYQYNNNATPTTMANGINGVDLGPNALVEQYPLTSAYTAGTTYIFTFMAAALNASDPTTLIASFGPNCIGDCEDAVFQQTTSNTALTQYSFTATGQDPASESYLYVETSGDGSAFVTGLDLEAAPAPIPGGGVLSLGALLAGLAFHAIRRRQSI